MAIKGREIREKLGNTVPLPLIMILESLAEENAVRKQSILDLAFIVDKCADSVALMISVNHNLKGALEANGFDAEEFAKLNAVTKMKNKDSNVNSEDMKNDDTKR